MSPSSGRSGRSGRRRATRAQGAGRAPDQGRGDAAPAGAEGGVDRTTAPTRPDTPGGTDEPGERPAGQPRRRRRRSRRGGRGRRAQPGTETQPSTDTQPGAEPSTEQAGGTQPSGDRTAAAAGEPGAARETRRGRSRRRRGARDRTAREQAPAGAPEEPPREAARRRGGRGRMRRVRTVDETSAGGLVVDHDTNCAALIGRLDRRGRLLWSLPKGHIEAGETAEQAAIREVSEETGIDGTVSGVLGTIDYWFMAEDRRVHKTVHHFLMRAIGGELSDADLEVTEVAWVPLAEVERRLVHADERRLVRRATRMLAESA